MTPCWRWAKVVALHPLAFFLQAVIANLSIYVFCVIVSILYCVAILGLDKWQRCCTWDAFSCSWYFSRIYPTCEMYNVAKSKEWWLTTSLWEFQAPVVPYTKCIHFLLILNSCRYCWRFEAFHHTVSFTTVERMWCSHNRTQLRRAVSRCTPSWHYPNLNLSVRYFAKQPQKQSNNHTQSIPNFRCTSGSIR